jgi:hypothetical protein
MIVEVTTTTGYVLAELARQLELARRNLKRRQLNALGWRLARCELLLTAFLDAVQVASRLHRKSGQRAKKGTRKMSGSQSGHVQHKKEEG